MEYVFLLLIIIIVVQYGLFSKLQTEYNQKSALVTESRTDGLTELANRRAYEYDIKELHDQSNDDNFVILFLDVNGLKVINDNMGHKAGDELICGAVDCMKSVFKNHGQIYRIGGDEFSIILSADKITLENLLNKFEKIVDTWHGDLVKELSIAYGFAEKQEFPDASISELSAIADKRMYQMKEAHYMAKGIDRRWLHEANTALCELYNKILKINITADTFTVVNMNVFEQKDQFGFSNKLSEWMTNFATKGLVHPQDLKRYLEETDLDHIRKWFAAGRNSYTTIYRRKVNNSYKKVLMEIIRAKDYTNENQSLFLYVREIVK